RPACTRSPSTRSRRSSRRCGGDPLDGVRRYPGNHDREAGALDRRRFFHVAGLSGATLLAACGEQNKAQGPIAGEKAQESAPEPADSDVADANVLNSALDLEHQAVAAYTAALRVLRGQNLRTARTFRDHERAHVQALSQAIKGLGGKPNQAQRSYRFPRLATEDDALRFAMTLENTAIAAYIDAIPRLNT